MSDDDEFNVPDFDNIDFAKLLGDLRNQAWMKVGAVQLGSAVVEYRKTMIDGGMSVDEANVMTANTVKEIIVGFTSTIPGILQVVMTGYEMVKEMEYRRANQKEHGPGKGEQS